MINPRLPETLPFDVVLKTSSGIELDLMLARPTIEGQLGPKAWSMEEVPTPTNVRVSEEGAGLVDLPPEMEATFFRDSHKGGMGTSQVTINATDYLSGVCETNVTGKVVKPPAVTEVTLPTSEGNVRCWEEATFSGTTYLYVSDGRYLHRSSDGAAFAQVLDTGSGKVITSVTFYGASDAGVGIVVCYETTSTGVASPYKYSEDGTTFSDANSGGNRELHFTFVEDQTLWGLNNPNNLYSSTDPFAAAATWSGSTKVGDESHDFQGGLVVAGVQVIFKTDRVYTVAADGTVSTLVAQFSGQYDTRNFESFVAASNSNIYFTVDEEVWEYDPVEGTLRALRLPLLPDTLLAPTTAHQDAVGYDGIALYALHHTQMAHESSGGTSIVRITLDADNEPVYERWLTTTASGYRPQGPFHVSRAFTSRKTGRALYFSTTTAGKVGILNLPKAFDPTLDSTAEYSAVAAPLLTGWITHNFPGQPKDYTEVTLDVTGLQPTNTTTSVNIYYYLNGDTSTKYTLKEGINQNGLHIISFPSAVTARNILLYFSLVSSTATETPIIFSWSIRASVKFRLREVMTLSARVIDKDLGRRSARSKHTAAEIRQLLQEIRATENLSIKYQDYRGYEFTNVRILPGFKEQDAIDEVTALPMTVLTFRVMRV